MKFRTEYECGRSSLVLSPRHPVVTAGSCFTQNISAKMEQHLWKAVNPFGTLYNPYSIAFAIDIMMDLENGSKRFSDSLFKFKDVWSSRMFDSSFSSSCRQDCIEEFLLRQKEFLNNLSEGKVLIITFGTSICYHLKETGTTVGNCHKQPSTLYYEKRMGEEEISAIWNEIIEKLKKNFPGINLIFTVSPVRHLKNGFIGNSRSKAVLQLAIETICEGNENCYYFPAYEIMNDDLRDYRFYATDLVHPSEEGIEYIWEKFCQTFLDENGIALLKEGSRKFKAANHRPKLGALSRPLDNL